MADYSATPTGPHPDPPTMELLDGDATLGSSLGSPSLVRFLKIARGTVYGVLLVAATGLLAVSAVPDLGRFASLLPAPERSAASAGRESACRSSCTTLDQVQFDQSNAPETESDSGGCSLATGGEEAETFLTESDALPPCCSSINRASLLARGSVGPNSNLSSGASCCESGEGCPLDSAGGLAGLPIDAGSLLAATSAEQPADKESAEERDVLDPDQDEVEE